MYRRPIFYVGVVFFGLAGLCIGQIDPRLIEQIKQKPVLQQEDLQTIDRFVAGQVRQVVTQHDFSQIGRTRAVLVASRGSQAQYAQQFTQSCRKHIASALDQSADMPADRRFLVILNLLILIDSLQDAELIELALPYITNQDPIIQYWAVRAVTGQVVADRIRKGNWPIAGLVMEHLKGLIKARSIHQTSDLVWGCIAELAARTAQDKGLILLVDVVQGRIDMFASGQVYCWPQVDMTLLRQTGQTLLHQPVDQSLVRRFAQLFSYQIQFLARSMQGKDPYIRQCLIAVVLDIEDKILTKALDGYRRPLRTAIESTDATAIMAAHDQILGTSKGSGILAAKWTFDYGIEPTGQVRTWPQALP